MGTVLTIFSWVPSLRNISFFSLLGDLALLVAMGVVVYYGATTYEIKPITQYPPINWETLPSFYGPVVFLFGIHMLVLPLQAEMEKPSLFEPVLSFSLVVVLLSNMAFALFSYLLYDTHIHPDDPITSSLPDGSLLLRIAAIALCGDLLFTFTIVFVAGRDVVESSLFDNKDESRRTHFKRCIVRSIMVAICTAIAVLLFKNFGNLVGLIAGLTFSVLCFVLPPIVYLLRLWPYEFAEGGGLKWFFLVLNLFIIVVGFVTAVLTTYQAIAGMLK